jgi:hypothetical protein
MIGLYNLRLAVKFTLIQFSMDLNEEKNYDFYILNKKSDTDIFYYCYKDNNFYPP